MDRGSPCPECQAWWLRCSHEGTADLGMEAPSKERRDGYIPVWTAGTQAGRRVLASEISLLGEVGQQQVWIPSTRYQGATEAVPPVQCYREQEQTTAKRECKQSAKAKSVSWPRSKIHSRIECRVQKQGQSQQAVSGVWAVSSPSKKSKPEFLPHTHVYDSKSPMSSGLKCKHKTLKPLEKMEDKDSLLSWEG